MSRRFVFTALTAFIISGLAPAAAVTAQNDFVSINTPRPEFQTIQDIRPSGYLSTVITLLLGGAGAAAFVLLLVGGIHWITSAGDKDSAEKARKTITNALLGLTLVFSIYAVLFMARILFGVSLVEFSLSPLGTSISSTGGGLTGGGGGATSDVCSCSDGGCASPGQIGLGSDGSCYLCTFDGWISSDTDICPPISCGTCD